MTRWMVLVLGLAAAGASGPARADDPPKKLTEAEKKELSDKLMRHYKAGEAAKQSAELAEAVKAYEDALAAARALYNAADHPNGHVNLATALGNLASLYQRQGKADRAEALHREALATWRRVYPNQPNESTAISALTVARLLTDRGRYAEAEPLYREALEVWQGLYKGDHPRVAHALHELALALHVQGKAANAEPLINQSLDMIQRLYKERDHADVATTLNTLAVVLRAGGKYAAAGQRFRESLDMRKRLFKGDHPHVATSMGNLANVLMATGDFGAATELYQDGLAMWQRLYKGDHPEVATSLLNVANLLALSGDTADAERLYREALGMRTRLHKGEDHPALILCMTNLAGILKGRGKFVDSEPLYKNSLDMAKRLFKGDHPDVASSLQNLGNLYRVQGKHAVAEPLLKDATDMYRRLTIEFAQTKSEGEALTFAAFQNPGGGGSYLSLARVRSGAGSGYDPATAYPAVWAGKGAVARVFEQRHLRARTAAADPTLVTKLAELSDARRRRADLLLAPAAADPAARKARNAELAALDAEIVTRERELSDRFPDAARAARLNAATPADLQKALPVDAALVDYVHYRFFERDDTQPAGWGEKWTARYLAFVVTKDKVAWVDLDTEDATKPAVAAWRKAIDSEKAIPAEIPAKVRDMVWGPVRKHLPAGVKVVYVCPDADLCRLPFAALPGDKPNTILLDEFAVAVVPHAPFLLDRLWPRDEPKNPPTAAVVVGGVDYAAAVAAGPKGAEPLVKPDQKLGWGFLPNTVGEAGGVASAADKRKLTVTRLEGDRATAAAVLAALPKARVAHLATHGFFADPSFRGLFQLDERDFKRAALGERVGRAANSPLVMTGVVLAGANDPKTSGRGIVTGEALVDLDLSGLELAVLSACETGLGDLGGGGEGVFGLQRAFHYAGARNVVCSLWKVPDQSTAALMKLFYQNLWEENLPPVEALRQAQLYLYRHPKEIEGLAKDFRGGFKTRPGASDEGPADASETAHPVKWAAFTLSGVGR